MSANTFITWLLCALACFGIAAQWDEPSETDAARATAAAARDVEREGARLARSAP